MNENDKQIQLVTFLLGSEKYGIGIMDVNGIQKNQEIRAIPNSPDFIEGIINLRGSIVPIINLHHRFHFKPASLSDEEKLLGGFIILTINDMQIGIIIDKILSVVTINTSNIQPPPQLMAGIGSEYIQGVLREEEGYLIMLNIRKLFSPQELQEIITISQ